jgi:deoxyribodipyrimidine photo-lyase
MSMIPYSFEPTRAAGLARLSQFAPRMSRDYAALRNIDEGAGTRDNVSMLSPHIRFRMITETEVLQTVFDRFTWASAEKYIQQLFWRAYFKGHLEMRPSIWRKYSGDLQTLENTRGDLAYQMAINGKTLIDCFDHWVEELKSTGYLHNHARMWFASIWIFTLRLPWQLGADFMYRHLIDGDPASNTLSWRWVGGLHTKGKTYLARPDNIAKYTNDRFLPKGLALDAPALEEPPLPNPIAIPAAITQWPEGRFGLLVTSEDLQFDKVPAASIAIALEPVAKPGGIEGDISAAFRKAALHDASMRIGQAQHSHSLAMLAPEPVLHWCKATDITTVAVAYAPVGPEADALAAIEQHLALHGIAMLRVRRSYDNLIWPLAGKGFFALKEQLPNLIEKLNLKSPQGKLI